MPVPSDAVLQPYLRRFRFVRAGKVGLDALVAAGVLAVLAALPPSGGVFRHFPVHAFFWPAAVLAAVVAFFFPAPSVRRLCARVDGYYGLKELITTGLDADSTGPFTSLLTTRAEAALRRGNPKEVFRAQLRPRHILIPLLAGLWGFLAFSGTAGMTPTQAEGRFLTDESRRLAARAEEYDLPYSREFARKMAALAEELENPALGGKEALRRIEKLRREVLGAMDDLERSWFSGAVEDPGGGEGAFSGDDERGPGNERAAAEGFSGSDSGESGTGGEPKEKSFREGDPGGEEPGEEEFSLEESKERMEQEMESLAETEESLSRAQQALEEGAGDSSGPEEQRGDPEEDGERLSEEEQEGAGVPGQESLADVPGEMYERSEDTRPSGIPLEGASRDDGSSLGAFIRTIPEYAYAELREQDTPAEYARMVEEAVVREDIPLGLRSIIRRYFLYTDDDSVDKEP